MLESVAGLYASIFLLFSDIMSWIMDKRRRRLLGSFSETTKRKFDDKVRAIGKMAEQIRYLAEQGSRAEARETRLMVERLLETDARLGKAGGARHEAEARYWEERREREYLEMCRERAQIANGVALARIVKGLLQEGALKSLQDSRLIGAEMRLFNNSATEQSVSQIAEGEYKRFSIQNAAMTICRIVVDV